MYCILFNVDPKKIMLEVNKIIITIVFKLLRIPKSQGEASNSPVPPVQCNGDNGKKNKKS